MKTGIFKVQVPLMTTDPEPCAYLYNESRSIYFYTPVTKYILRLMNGEFKKFFELEYSKRTKQITFIKEIKDPRW